MSGQLCIILRNHYDARIKKHVKWNEEVRIDSETVKEVLCDHDILEIIIPVSKKPNRVVQIVGERLAAISSKYESCHIVLNTHGMAGASDLTNAAVKQALLVVSLMDIRVSQISALQCHGMSSASVEDQRAADRMKPVHAAIRAKISTMNDLQQQLNTTCTSRPQAFAIYGFDQSYEPDADKELVVKVLKGDGVSLQVSTTVPVIQSQEDYLEEVNQSIQTIRSTPVDARKDNLQYDKAGNRLAKVLEAIKKNISDYLQNISGLYFESKLLLAQLEQCAQGKENVLNAKNLNVIFKRWSKEHKIYSEARLDVLQAYHDRLNAGTPGASLVDRDTDASIMASVGLFALGKPKQLLVSPVVSTAKIFEVPTECSLKPSY